MSTSTDLDTNLEGGNVKPSEIEVDSSPPTALGSEGMGVVLGIAVEVEIVLGSVSMPLSKLMKLSRGAVIPLERKVGEPVDIIVNNKVVARGEVVILDEDHSRFGVCLTSVAGIEGQE